MSPVFTAAKCSAQGAHTSSAGGGTVEAAARQAGSLQSRKRSGLASMRRRQLGQIRSAAAAAAARMASRSAPRQPAQPMVFTFVVNLESPEARSTAAAARMESASTRGSPDPKDSAPTWWNWRWRAAWGRS